MIKINKVSESIINVNGKDIEHKNGTIINTIDLSLNERLAVNDYLKKIQRLNVSSSLISLRTLSR